MEQHRNISPNEARELILQDSSVANFLKIGLFSKELKNYLDSRDINIVKGYFSSLFSHEDPQLLTEKISGEHFKIFYGHTGGSVKRSNRAYPGMHIYYTGYFGKFDGYPRIIYEILDSGVKTNPVNILWRLQERKTKFKDLYLSMDYDYRHRNIQRLSSLGFVSLDGKNLELKDITRKIFSPEIKEIWEELKKWEYRIDVW